MWICVGFAITCTTIPEHMALFPPGGWWWWWWSIKKEQRVWSSCGERQVQMSWWPCASRSQWLSVIFFLFFLVYLKKKKKARITSTSDQPGSQINSWIGVINQVTGSQDSNHLFDCERANVRRSAVWHPHLWVKKNKYKVCGDVKPTCPSGHMASSQTQRQLPFSSHHHRTTSDRNWSPS